MPYRLPRNFGERFTEILTSYQLALEDECGLVRLTHLNQIRDFLAWVRRHETDIGDIFADAGSRDRAVGFYKRALFQRGINPQRINAILASLSRFYLWWGLGPHTVPSLTLSPPDPAGCAADSPDDWFAEPPAEPPAEPSSSESADGSNEPADQADQADQIPPP